MRPGSRSAPAAQPSNSRLRKELLILLSCLVCGTLVVPVLVWFGAQRFLGPYTHGADTHAGALALLSDFLSGLLHGSMMFWLVALGPAVMLTFARVMFSILRQRPA